MKNIFFLLLISTIQPVLSQTKLEKAITNLENNYEQEKVYLLTDKPQYVAGDQIWFKSFVFDGYNRSALSTTLFVELYNADKKLIDWKTILLTNGEGSGDFKLKEDLPEQVYFVRAYTPYMNNFADDFQIAKTIPIYNPNATETLEISKNSDWTAKAFPESGNFIDGMPTKFAVRLLSDNIFPENWTGKVIDTQNPNTAITTFKSFDKNVASFKITPALGKKYQVIIQDNAGKNQTIDLPAVAGSGANLEVSSSKEGIKYTLKGVNLKQQLQNYKIVGTINNHLAYKANISQLTNEASSLIPVKISNGANGILQLVIFDDQDNLVAKRLCFIKPNNLKLEKATIIDQSLKHTPRAFNSVDLSPETYFKNYTVLVSEDNGNAGEDENLLSRLWLTGDFTTKIDSPAQYFSKNANSEALDALLISETWKRYDWNAVLSGSAPTIKENSQKFLSYRVKPIKDNGLMKDTSVNLVLKLGENEPTINQFRTDQNGYVYLNNLSFDESLNVSLFVNSEKNKEAGTDNLFVTVEPLVNPTPFKGNFPTTKYKLTKSADHKTLSQTISRAINAQKNNKKAENVDVQIEEVKLTGKKADPKEELDKQLSSGMFSSMNTTIFDFVNEDQNIAGSTNILDWLQGRAAGLTFQRNNSGVNVPYIRNQQAKLYLDEVQTDPTMIANLPVSNIAMVKIIKESGLVGNAVAIYTMKGNMKSKSNEKQTQNKNSSVVKGYDKPSEFLIEMLDSDDSSKKVESDTRETLYWNPNLFDSDNVPPRIKFFNNDTAKQYKMLIISFDEDDNLLYDEEILK